MKKRGKKSKEDPVARPLCSFCSQAIHNIHEKWNGTWFWLCVTCRMNIPPLFREEEEFNKRHKLG